jgi:hypothetical protein
MIAYLRPGGRDSVEAVVGEAGLLEVTAADIHMLELGPPNQQRLAVEALRSLPWVQTHELPSETGI